MLLSYKECINIYKTDYNIKAALKRKEIFKIDTGIYSDIEIVNYESIIQKKYPNAVFTLNSAFYYQGLTDTIPTNYHIITSKDASKISNKHIKQLFDNNNSLDFGVETIQYCGDEIKVFTKERLLIELIRYKSKLPYDYYKEIINNYRNILFELNFELIEDYAKKLPKYKLVIDIIQKEVI